MANQNPGLGSPSHPCELLKLGLEISERTVSRYLSRLPGSGGTAQLWRTLLKNHRED
jgi:hypothetical protein